MNEDKKMIFGNKMRNTSFLSVKTGVFVIILLVAGFALVTTTQPVHSIYVFDYM
jgi:hypothetical protein